MRSELVLKFVFEASHSLAGYEEPHPHLWRLEVCLVGQIFQGKIIDIVKAREAILAEVRPLEKTFMNDNLKLDEPARKAPTCETLCQYFWNRISKVTDEVFVKENRTVLLDGIGIALCDMNGVETGLVRFYPG